MEGFAGGLPCCELVLFFLKERYRATAAIVDEAGCRKEYLYSSATRKEERAREIAKEDGVTSGLICVLDCVEPCWSYQPVEKVVS